MIFAILFHFYECQVLLLMVVKYLIVSYIHWLKTYNDIVFTNDTLSESLTIDICIYYTYKGLETNHTQQISVFCIFKHVLFSSIKSI